MSKLVENQYDAYCKKVLRFKKVMAKILHDTVNEFKSMTLDEIDLEDNSALMMLSILFSAKLSRKDRFLYLEKYYDIVLTEAEKEVIGQMCNAHEGIYEYGKEDGVKIGLIEGEEIGLAKGEKIGFSKGQTSEKRSIAKKMLKLGVSLEIITMTTGLTYSEVMDLKH